MRIGIFYYSQKDGPGRQHVVLPKGGHVYIRVEEVEGDDVANALDEAQLQRGEQLMNTHIINPIRRRKK